MLFAYGGTNYIPHISTILMKHTQPPHLEYIRGRPQVYHFKWYMAHFGAASAKPERGWTNNPNFARLDQGKLDRKSFRGTVKTVKKTISKTTGKQSYTGTKELKGTQSGACSTIYKSAVTFLNQSFKLFAYRK